MNRISFYQYIQIFYLYVIIIFCLILTFINFRLKASGNLFRFLFMFIIVLSLTNPVIISENRESIPDTVAVLLDLSPSQNINNRKENALKTYDNIKKQLEKKDNIEVRYKTVKGEKGTKVYLMVKRVAVSYTHLTLPTNREV